MVVYINRLGVSMKADRRKIEDWAVKPGNECVQMFSELYIDLFVTASFKVVMVISSNTNS